MGTYERTAFAYLLLMDTLMFSFKIDIHLNDDTFYLFEGMHQ